MLNDDNPLLLPSIKELTLEGMESSVAAPPTDEILEQDI